MPGAQLHRGMRSLVLLGACFALVASQNLCTDDSAINGPTGQSLFGYSGDCAYAPTTTTTLCSDASAANGGSTVSGADATRAVYVPYICSYPLYYCADSNAD